MDRRNSWTLTLVSGVENDIQEEDLLLRRTEGVDVGSLAER
jgi:hypothetical protein